MIPKKLKIEQIKNALHTDSEYEIRKQRYIENIPTPILEFVAFSFAVGWLFDHINIEGSGCLDGLKYFDEYIATGYDESSIYRVINVQDALKYLSQMYPWDYHIKPQHKYVQYFNERDQTLGIYTLNELENEKNRNLSGR